MRSIKCDAADRAWHFAVEAEMSPADHRRGLCRLGEALHELLALYPLNLETDASETAAAWPRECFQAEIYELATV